MFRLLATTTATNCKRQQIAILIISFFAYVSGIRNEGNNMLLQQQQTTVENSNYQSPMGYINQPTNSDFRPSPIIDFTPADAVVPQQFKPTYIESTLNSVSSSSNPVLYSSSGNNNNNNKNKQYLPQKQEIENDNRRYTIEKAEAATVTYGNIAKKQFSFPNEQQHTPQHLTDKPIYIYRDPYTNENYHYTPTETSAVKGTPATIIYNLNNYNKQQQQHHYHQYQNNNNQEYLVQSSMIVGTQPQQLQQQQVQQLQQQQQQQPSNPFRPQMSFSADKDVYLKRPGLVYDEKSGYNHPNSVVEKKEKKSEEIKDKISYDSHDYPPPSYFQQQTSNFLPTPVPATTKPKPTTPSLPPPPPPPINSSLKPFRQNFRPTSQSSIFGQQRPPQQQYLQSSQSSLPYYVNNIDNYLLNKQPSADYYRTEVPPPTTFSQRQPQLQLQYETRPPPFYEYDTRPPPSSTSSAFYQQQQQQPQQQYLTRPPPPYPQPPSYVNTQQPQYPAYESVRPPPPDRPSYNNYYDYQIGEIPPPQEQITGPPSQHFNYPYPIPPPSPYPYQGPYRPPPPPPSQQQSGLASLVQYAPQLTSLLLSGVGGGGGSSSNTNSPLGSLIGALTGTTAGNTPQQSVSNFNRRPVNSQLIRALENIARNDDLQCVPKVLCQMIAGQTQRGQLPAFITSPTITNFLSGFPASSPALIYGRAALLGLSGGEKSCHQTYVKCPRNEYEIIYYLNNHRGGFFKFFSEPEEQQQNVNHDSTQQGATSLFSILSALTGTPSATTTTPRPTPKPQAPSTDITSGIGNFFTQLLSDYMGGATVEYQRSLKKRAKRFVDDKIKFEGESAEETPPRDAIKFREQSHEENIFKFKDKTRQNSHENHVDTVKFHDDDYDAYLDVNQDNEKDFHDEEDEEDTQLGVKFKDDDDEDYLDDTQGRILHKARGTGKRFKFFPETRENSNEDDKEQQLKNIIKKFNDFNRQRKLKFPSETQKREYEKAPSSDDKRQGKLLNDDLTSYDEQNYGHQFTNYVENSYEDFQKESKRIKFVDDITQENDHTHQASSLYSYYLHKPKDQKTKLVFPEREGKILNRPYYAASYLQDYYHPQNQEEDESQQADKFVIADNQRPSRYSEFPPTSTANIYNTHINTLQSHKSFSSNTAVNNNIYVASLPGPKESNSNHFLPTPPPTDDAKDDTVSNAFVYSNSDYNSNKQHNFNSLTHREYYKTQRYPSSSSSNSALNSIANSFYKPQRYTNNNNRYYKPSSSTSSSSYYTTKRPYTIHTTKKPDDKNIYVTNSRGVTEYYITPDGRKVYL